MRSFLPREDQHGKWPTRRMVATEYCNVNKHMSIRNDFRSSNESANLKSIEAIVRHFAKIGLLCQSGIGGLGRFPFSSVYILR
jgi:hypothetical protein